MPSPPQIFISSDQPDTCPYCGTRPQVLSQTQEGQVITQTLKCRNLRCGQEFEMGRDADFEYYDKAVEQQYLGSDG